MHSSILIPIYTAARAAFIYWYLGEGPYLFSPHLLSNKVKMKITVARMAIGKLVNAMPVAAMGDDAMESVITLAKANGSLPKSILPRSGSITMA